jgi:hypothetical protein
MHAGGYERPLQTREVAGGVGGWPGRVPLEALLTMSLWRAIVGLSRPGREAGGSPGTDPARNGEVLL